MKNYQNSSNCFIQTIKKLIILTLYTGGSFEKSETSVENKFCLNDEPDVGSIEPFAPVRIEKYFGLGTTLKYVPETQELFATAGESDRIYIVTLKKNFKFEVHFNHEKREVVSH